MSESEDDDVLPPIEKLTAEQVKALPTALLRQIAARFLTDDERQELGEYERKVVQRSTSDSRGPTNHDREVTFRAHDRDPHDRDPHDKANHDRANHGRENHSRR